MGLSLPPPLPSRRGHVHDAQIRLGSAMLGNWNDSLDHLVHLLVAFILALPIGWHRSREEHGAGLRTFPLVAMAACGFVQTGISVLGSGAATQANIMQGVIIGVGLILAAANLAVLLMHVKFPTLSAAPEKVSQVDQRGTL